MDFQSISSDASSSFVPIRTSSPDKARKVRRGNAIEFGDRTGTSDGLLSQGFANSRPSTLGRYSEERIKRRDNALYAAPNEDDVANIIQSLDRRGSANGTRLTPLTGSRGGSILSPIGGPGGSLSGDSINNVLNSSGSINSGSYSRKQKYNKNTKVKKNNFLSASQEKQGVSVETSQLTQIPNARLGFEVPIANDTSMFGSTQLSGCKGDFCDFDVDSAENPELGNGKINFGNSKGGINTLNEFRKRLSLMDQSDEDIKKETSLMTSMLKGDTKKHKSASNLLEKPTKFVPYNIIMQCRMEMPFVKLQLRRHKSHEAGDYCSEDNYQDLAAGMKLPAHYYNDVPVCQVCYNLYNIILNARQKAVAKIMKKKDDDKLKALMQSSHTMDYYNAKREHNSRVPSNVLRSVEVEKRPTLKAKDSGIGVALEAVSGLTKHDVAEIRTLSKPHAAVVVVMEALSTLLTGAALPWEDLKKLLASGDLFLNMLKEFRLEQVTDEKLRRLESYVDNPLFRPDNVRPVSLCASKFCAWVLGVVQAARWERGQGHKRTNFLAPAPSAVIESVTNNKKSTQKAPVNEKLTNLNNKNNKRLLEENIDTPSYARGGRSVSPVGRSTAAPKGASLKHLNNRDMAVFKAAQNKSVNRLASLVDNGKKLVGEMVQFRCRDGVTKMPYVVIGSIPLKVERCNFIVIHDFFDTCDGTSILFKPLAQKHPGSQVICFNYPGQSNTVWPRPPKVEKERGAKETILNNDWIADRVHELLQHIEQDGGIMLSSPFHLVGIGNGACIAAAFLQRWGKNPHYARGLRSMVSINGFLSPDPQISGILHQAAQLFENTPHNRPDIPVSYWARFMFSNQYLEKIHPNLALNIYTAVSNPITNDGRYKIASGCLNHRDIRGGLAPDVDLSGVSQAINFELSNVTVPVLVLQSTENALVNASNVDPFLTGRTLKHLWSHQQNYLSPAVLARVKDVTSQWVGGMASGPEDYADFSILGKDGIRMLLDTLQNSRGCFCMWTTAGHLIQQENKRAILDFLDVLACPTEKYTGIEIPNEFAFESSNRIEIPASLRSEGLPCGAVAMSASGKVDPDLESSFDVTGSLVLTKPTYGESGKIEREADSFGTEESPRLVLKLGDSNEAEEIVDDETHKNSKKVVEELFGGTADSEIKEELDTDVAFKDEEEVLEEVLEDVDVREIGDDEDASVASAIEEVQDLMESSIGSQENCVAVMSGEENYDDNADMYVPGTPPAATPRCDSNVSLGLSNDLSKVVVMPPDEKDVLAEIAVEAELSKSRSGSPAKPKNVKSNAAQLNVDSTTLNTRSYPAVPPRVSVPTQVSVASTSHETTPNEYLTEELAPSISSDSAVVTTPKDDKTVSVCEEQNSIVESKSGATDASKANQYHAGHKPSIAADNVIAITSKDDNLIATREEQNRKTWTENGSKAADVSVLESELALKQKQYIEIQAKLEQDKVDKELLRLQRLKNDQYQRAKQYEEEDKALLASLEKELNERRRQRAAAEKQRLLEIQSIDQKLVESGVIDAYAGSVQGNELFKLAEEDDVIMTEASKMLQVEFRDPVKELPPMRYGDPTALPTVITEHVNSTDVVGSLDKMIVDEQEQKKKGNMSVEQFESVKRQMAQRQMERDQKLRHLAGDEQHMLFENSAVLIQRIGRGYNGRWRAAKVREARDTLNKLNATYTKAHALARGMIGRMRFRKIKQRYLQTLKYGESTLTAQRVFRGHLARKRFKKLKRFVMARNIERVFRGHLGRKAARREKDRIELLRRKQVGACKIQSAWRMKVAKEEFRSMRIWMLAAIELQRCYRGYLGRKRLSRRRKWESTKPGPDRIKLGLELIEESKVAFERQQEEIDALHRAQERAEARVSHITTDLRDSEKELMVLERELQEIDQIERDLITLTHERELLSKNVRDAAGMPRIAEKGHDSLVMGKEPSFQSDPDLERRKKAEAYALEMTIQIKRAEREKKRQELETEFAAVFQDVEKKKKALQRLEASLADMESTRERKDREFRRLQKNLMQLLLEQKQELDELREKGIELETATATTAAAATATAQKAKEHEKQSTAMFSQTEELMKFQFMSMSLSYFSSLNMLKQLRDMNADTTSAAVASSADAAAAAAASAAAANLPSMKQLDLGANDVIELSIQKKKAELEAAEAAEKEAKAAKANPLPDNVKLWTCSDVIRWLGTLSLSQYGEKFREATVDGPFLMELREEDLVDVLAIKHKLHVRKILVSREKLKPLSEQELARKEIVEREEKADAERAAMGVPSVDTVFSQARNGRIKRIEESLNLGFPIDSVDERGNTLLLLACQNSNKRLAEMLLLRGANVNHQNVGGNTALHFALAFDAEGMLGEYLIEHGADDSLENAEGLTPYDGVTS